MTAVAQHVLLKLVILAQEQMEQLRLATLFVEMESSFHTQKFAMIVTQIAEMAAPQIA